MSGRATSRVAAVRQITRDLKLKAGATLIDIGNNDTVKEIEAVAKDLGIKSEHVTLTDIYPKAKGDIRPMKYIQIVDNQLSAPACDVMVMMMVFHHIPNDAVDAWTRNILGRLKMNGSLLLREHDLPNDEATAALHLKRPGNRPRDDIIYNIMVRHPRDAARMWLSSKATTLMILEHYGMELKEEHVYDNPNPMGVYHARLVRVRDMPDDMPVFPRVEYDWRLDNSIRFLDEQPEKRREGSASWRRT